MQAQDNEELNQSVSGEVVSNSDYIDAIKDLKQNTVAKSDYEALKADNKKLLDTLVNGQLPNTEPVKPTYNKEELRESLFRHGEDLSNLEYVDKALKLRQAILDEGGMDPFLPTGKKIVPTDTDIECANRVAAVMQECVDYADGDSQIFTQELMRRTVDVGPSIRKK